MRKVIIVTKRTLLARIAVKSRYLRQQTEASAEVYKLAWNL